MTNVEKLNRAREILDDAIRGYTRYECSINDAVHAALDVMKKEGLLAEYSIVRDEIQVQISPDIKGLEVTLRIEKQ